MAQPLFSLTNVSYSYEGTIQALKNLTLSIGKGKRIAFIGANGTGKSTLLSLLDALIFPTSGSIAFNNEEITAKCMSLPQTQRLFRKKVGYVFQNSDIQLFCPTVKDDLLFGPLQIGIDKKEMGDRFDSICQQLHLHELLDRSPHQLSIGERKRVAIASTLIIDPEVLLLDEPTAGLDPQTTRDIIGILVEAHAMGKTIIFATHDLHIVEEIADEVHVFGNNKTIIRSGSPEEIVTDTAFLQQNNLLHIHMHRHFHRSHIHSHIHES